MLPFRAAPDRFALPLGLEAQMRRAITRNQDQTAESGAGRSRSRALTVFLTTAAVLMFTAALLIAWSGRVQYRFEDDLVADHVRSLQANHLFDVPSTDQHTVKPWFQGKIDFSPSVPELAPQGFPLLGGRLDYVTNHPAAAIVYGRAKHVINVLVTRHANADLPNGVIDKNGYHVIAWEKGGLDYWAVSDVNPTDLEMFRSAFIAGS